MQNDFHISTCVRCGSQFKVDFSKGNKFRCPVCGEIAEYIECYVKDEEMAVDLIDDKKQDTN